MLITFVVLLVLFLILSILSFMGRLTMFIAGKRPENSVENLYDEKGAGNFLGIIMSLLVVSSAIGMLGFVLDGMRWLILASPIAFVLLLVFALIFINTNNRFAFDEFDDEDEE